MATIMGMPFGRDHQVIPPHECLALAATQSIGRVGMSMGALPVVLPVNFALWRGRVVFRTGPGSKLAAALRGAVVCFEVDQLDPEHRAGWSVLITGTASELTGDDAVEAGALVDPWSDATGDHVIAITTELVSGRRVGSAVCASA